MKITFLLPTVNMSGGIRVVSIYAKALEEMGHDVVLISPPHKKFTFKHKIKSLLKLKGWPKKYNTKSHIDKLKLDHRILNTWRPIIDSDVPDADVVIATWWETAIWAQYFSKSKGSKVYFMQDYGGVPGQPLDKIKETWVLPFHIITISRWLEGLVKSVTHNNSKITLVQNGIALSSFNSPIRDKNKVPTVGFLYTDAPQKGADLMFSAFMKAKLSVPKLRLVMFGSKDLPDKMKSQPDVIYHQGVSDEEIVNIYSSCDVWLFGSSREGFGLPILEAMACRTPVIATIAGAAEELVSPKVGSLLTSRGVDEMASEILKITNLDDASWQALSDGAYQEAKNNSWDSAVNKFNEALKALVGNI